MGRPASLDRSPQEGIMCRASQKTHRSCGTWCLVGCAGLLAVIGCIGNGFSHHWTESNETRTVPAIGTKRVSVKTTNGYVRVRPAKEGSDEIEVLAHIRAGGQDRADAEDCLAAIEITTPVAGKDESTLEIGWAWRERKLHWQADVAFDISMPVNLDLAVDSTNGNIDVVGLLGDCHTKTVNGATRVVAAKDSVQAESTNGQITVDSPAATVELITTNGRVRAKLANADGVAGKLRSVNGSVNVGLVKTANVALECRTTNGRVRNSLPLADVHKTGRNRLSGHLAGGDNKLDVRTTNGDIVLEPYSAGRRDRDDD